jgi:glutamyl endopeptidase
VNPTLFTRRLARSTVAGLALAAVLVTSTLSAGSASAQTSSDPIVLVSDTGETVPAADVKIDAALSEAAIKPHKGTGARAPKDQQAINLAEQIGKASLPTVQQDSKPKTDVKPESLYVDTRYPIATTTWTPGSAIVLLTLDNGGSSYRCSGFLIGPDTVATAGHCVHFNGAWSYNVRAYPGYTGSVAPFGSCGYRSLRSVTAWTQNKNPAYDFGVVKLDCAIGNSTGWLGLYWQTASLNGLAVHIQGYPADKGWGQWGHDGTVGYSFPNYTYSSYTTKFNGSPIFTNSLQAVSIYTTTAPDPSTCNGDICSTTSAYYSVGTRITQEVFNWLVYWKSL